MILGNQIYPIRKKEGDKAEDRFYNIMVNKFKIQLKRENLPLSERNKGDKINNHQPDFYYKNNDKHIFIEFKATHNIRVDLFDLYIKWYNRYCNNINNTLLYMAILKGNMRHIEFYNIFDLQQSKPYFKQGKWSDGNGYYVVNPEIVSHKILDLE